MFARVVTYIPQGDCIDYKLLGSVQWPQPRLIKQNYKNVCTNISGDLVFPWLAMPELWEPRLHFLYKLLKVSENGLIN